MKSFFYICLFLLLTQVAYTQNSNITFQVTIDNGGTLEAPVGGHSLTKDDFDWELTLVGKCTKKKVNGDNIFDTWGEFPLGTTVKIELNAFASCGGWSVGDPMEMKLIVNKPGHPLNGAVGVCSFLGSGTKAYIGRDGIVIEAPAPTMTVSNATLCLGETGKFVTAAPVGAPTGYTIDWGDANITSKTTDVNIGEIGAGLGVGVHNLTATVKKADGTATTTTAKYTVTVNAYPNAVIKPANPEVCSGLAMDLTAEGGDAYKWTVGSTATTAKISTGNLTVDKTFKVEVSLKGCKKEATTTVKVNPLPTVTVGAQQDKCKGAKVDLTANGSGGTGALTYTWTNGGGTTQNPTGVAVPNAGNNDYVVTVKDTKGCEVTATQKVIGHEVTAAIAGSTSVTHGATVTLTANPTYNPTGGAAIPESFSWTGDINGALTTKVVTSNAITASETFTVKITDKYGCTGTANHTVAPSGGALAGIATGGDVCQGTALTLKSNATGGSGNYATTTWAPSTGLILKATTGATVQVDPSTPAGDYTVSVVIKDGITTLSAQTINVKIKALPTLANISAPVTIYAGQSTTVSVDPTPEDAVCTWMPGNRSGEKWTVTPIATTTYTVTAAKDGCTSAPESVVVTVNTGAPLSGTPTDNLTECQGTALTLKSNATGGSGNYATTAWRVITPNLQLSALFGENVDVLATTPAGTYSVGVTISDGTTTLPEQIITLTVKPMPTLAGISATPSTINAGQSSTLTVTPTPSTATCEWTPGNFSGKTHTVTPIATTTYTVTATTLDGCKATADVTVTVNAGPGLALTGGDVNGCEGENLPELSVTATGGTAPYTFTWTPVAGLTFDTQSDVGGVSKMKILNGATLEASTFNVPVSVKDANGTTKTTTIKVTITKCTCTARLAMTLDTKTCASATATTTLTLTASGSTTYSFALKDERGNTALTATKEAGPWTYTVAYADRGKYRVENFKGFSAAVPAGCDGATPTDIDVDFWEQPSVNAGADLMVCGTEQVTLKGTGTAGVTYTWDNGAVDGVAFTPVMGSVTTYTVTGVDGHGCSATDDIMVSVNPKPTVTAAVDRNEICKGETVTLTSGGTADVYVWTNGGLNNTPVAPANTVRYTVTGTVTATGCSDTASVVVKVNMAPEIIKTTPVNRIKRIAIGKDAVLSVEAIGENLTYQWWRQAAGGTWTELINSTSGYPQIMGVATTELTLKAVPQSWHNSKFKCVVTNACGFVEAEFSLSVSECFEIKGDLVMGAGIMPDEIPGDAIDGWYCIGTRIALHAKITQEEGYDIDNPHYKWFIDGELAEKVIETDSSTLSWVPEFWEDDIVVKVCVYADGACEEVCTKYLRLKSRPYEDARVKILTSIDPERSFCPGEVIDFTVSTKGEGTTPTFVWQNDVFDMGTGRTKRLTMTEEDTWIKVTMSPSAEICVQSVISDTIHLVVKKSVEPTLSIINSISDTLACRGDDILFTAIYTNAGANPTFKWEYDTWDGGKESTSDIKMADKDMWVKCELFPSKDVCYDQEKVYIARMHMHVLEDVSVSITSDMADKMPGDDITFESEVQNFIDNMKYEWFVNEGLMSNNEEDYIASNLRKGDVVYCAVSGNLICQTRVFSNKIDVQFGTITRDTIVEIYKNERISKLNLFKMGDEDRIFLIPNDGRPAFGVANITAKGLFNYTPAFDFSGDDMVRYLVRDKWDKNKVEEGYVYISVKENNRFFVPNIITPNGDGLNDTWILDFLSEYPDHSITVYNSTGTIVFSAKNYQNDWDGTGQNNIGYVSQFNLPNGVYTYVIDLGNKTILKSWIEIRADFNRGKYR